MFIKMVYPIGKRVLAIFKLWIKRIEGIENIPNKGPFIIAANHSSYMDHLIIWCTFVSFLNKKIHFLSKKEHFNNPIKRAWHSWVGAIPIDRESGGKEALRWAIVALKKEKIIAIHPEGTRSLTGRLQKGKTGVVRLALAAKVPIVPVGLIGTFEILPKGKNIPKFKRATMRIGEPIYLSEHYRSRKTKKLFRELTTKVMKEIAKLTGQVYRFG